MVLALVTSHVIDPHNHRVAYVYKNIKGEDKTKRRKYTPALLAVVILGIGGAVNKGLLCMIFKLAETPVKTSPFSKCRRVLKKK